MKFCVAALLGAALFLALATTSTAEPSSDKKGQTSTQVHFFLSHLKASMTKTSKARRVQSSHQVKVHPSVQLKGSFEDLNLDSFLNFLRWLSAEDAETITQDIFVILEDSLNLYVDYVDALYGYFEDTPVDMYELYNEYYFANIPPLEQFWYRSDDFWRAWVDDKENIPQNLAIYLPHIQAFLTAFGSNTYAYYSKVEEFTRIFLAPENYALLDADTEKALAEFAGIFQKLKDRITPPSEETPEPPTLTVEQVIGFWKYFSELNATSIILGALETVVQVREVRHQFEDSLALIFWEANELDLVSEASNITGNLQVALDYRQIQNRLTLDNFVYNLYYGQFLDFLDAFSALLLSWIDGFNELPDITLATAEQLQALAQTTAPEVREKAQVLTQESLDKLSLVLQTFFDNFKPKN